MFDFYERPMQIEMQFKADKENIFNQLVELSIPPNWLMEANKVAEELKLITNIDVRGCQDGSSGKLINFGTFKMVIPLSYLQKFMQMLYRIWYEQCDGTCTMAKMLGSIKDESK